MIPAPTVEVYDEDGGTALGMIPALVEFSLSEVFCDVGSLELSFPRDLTGATLLDTDADRQVRVRQSGAPDMWFLLDDDSRPGVSDAPESEVVKFGLRSLAGVLDEARVAPSGGAGSTPAERAFTSATPGAIIETLWNEAQGRGLLENCTLLGEALQDAAATSWPETVSFTYRIGTTLLEVVKGLSDQQLLEWRFNGRNLELYVPGTVLDRDYLSVVFRPRRDVTSAPYARTRRGIATAVLVEGESDANVRRTQSLSGRRAREAFVSQTQVASGALIDIGDWYLAAHAASDVQVSMELVDAEDTPAPWAEYRCGDRVPTLIGPQSVDRRRVMQIVRQWTGDGNVVSLELGSLLRTAEEQFEARLRRLQPGDGSLT